MNQDAHQVEAWFAPQIPISNGPMQFGQLPGMILELDIDHGQAHMLASDIQFMSLDKDAIEKPSSGKKVSRQEFQEIETQKQKEMEEEYGGGGNRMIIRQRRE
jgi:GLPGLI family protein